jgi:8-amino-7-oxononanoate synthase
MVVESLYSMEGDLAPLTDLWALAQEEDAFLIVDEAHATGVFGSQGRGLAAQLEGQEQVITIRTCGKALGCEGALVCGSAIVRDFLVNRGRGFIFSTAPSPLMAALVRSALDIAASSDRRDRLLALMTYAQERLSRLGANSSDSQIIPLIVGDDSETMRLAGELQTRGFDIRGIRPPTVPEGTSRLRISLTLNVEEQDVDALCSAIAELRH